MDPAESVTRVRVSSRDQRTEMGEGVYMGEVPLPADAREEFRERYPKLAVVFGEEMTTPLIKLDSGEIVLGCYCWWTFIPEMVCLP